MTLILHPTFTDRRRLNAELKSPRRGYAIDDEKKSCWAYALSGHCGTSGVVRGAISVTPARIG